MRTSSLALLAFFAVVAAAPAQAQAPRITRGTIEKVDGAALTLRQAAGPDLTVKLADNAKVFGVKAATIADVKPGDWIGVGAMPQPDGSQKAIEVTIFSEAQRGVGEGFRPWTRPGSTMTNGTAGSPVSSVNGRVVTVKYKGGEQKIVIGPDAKIRMYVVGSKSDLKPGARVALYNPQKAADGSLQAARVNVGLGAMAP
jgi:Domain of unknown function (DUF5666)